jgi:MerR family transcriptional regulator, light-induced transcriptional regulator
MSARRHAPGEESSENRAVVDPEPVEAPPVEAPPVEAPLGGPTPALTVAAVARRLGVAPATLRTWDRRYGLGATGHAAGSHRRYTATDVARLDVMRRLTLQGAAPAEAARVALATDCSSGSAAAAAEPPRATPDDGRGGGGRVVSLPGASPAARGLARAAMALDAQAARRIVGEHLARFGVVVTWEQLLGPVLAGVGDRWESTGAGVDVEHVLSEVVMGELRLVSSRQGEPLPVRPVLLACADQEQHTLPLHALASALAERRVGCRVLGARVPPEALAAAVRRSGPSVVFVWSQLPDTGDPVQLATVPTTRPALRLVVGGPGWQGPLPAGSTRVGSLAEAVEVVSRAATA